MEGLPAHPSATPSSRCAARREESTRGLAIHNLESSPGLVRCDLLREGVLRDAASFPLALEMDPATRVFTTLPVVPVPEGASQE